MFNLLAFVVLSLGTQNGSGVEWSLAIPASGVLDPEFDREIQRVNNVKQT